jgi:hypothetical protein
MLSEEFDVAQHQMRGNLPQAFAHALLLESAVRLAGPNTGWLPEEAPRSSSSPTWRAGRTRG